MTFLRVKENNSSAFGGVCVCVCVCVFVCVSVSHSTGIPVRYK